MCPLQKNDEAVTTQFPHDHHRGAGPTEDGLLGLRTLTVIRDALAFIKQNHGVELDIDHIDMDDPEVYAMISPSRDRRGLSARVRGHATVPQGAAAQLL